MYFVNTWFTQEKRQRYSWTKPGDTGQYQINYIIAKCRFLNSIVNAKAYPYIDLDHNPVAANMQIKLKQVTKAKLKQHWKLDRLKDPLLSMEYRCAVNANMLLGFEVLLILPVSYGKLR